MYPQPGSYESPYDRNSPQWWGGGMPPWMQMNPWMMQQQMMMQPQLQLQLGGNMGGGTGGGDMNMQLISLLLSLPAVQNGAGVASNLFTQLQALTAPPVLTANPVMADYNNLLSYATSVKNAVQQAVGNDSTVFGALKQQLLISAFTGMAGGGGGNSMLPLVLLLAVGGLST